MDRRTQLLQAAATTYARHGYLGSTTRRIAEEAGVNEVTIFRHFGSKDALLQEAIATCGGAPQLPDLPEVPRQPAEELAAWGATVLERICTMRTLIRRCVSEQEEHPHFKACGNDISLRLSATLRRYLAGLHEHGMGDGEFDVRTAAAMFMGALFADAMGRDRMPDVYPHTPAAAAKQYTNLLLRAIGVQAPDSSSLYRVPT
jgi:AcrR family transcriptional regulator